MIGSRTKNSVVGIAIRDDGVQVVRLTRSSGGARVAGFGVAPLPAGAVTGGAVADSALLAEGIREACRRAMPEPVGEGVDAVVAIPETKTFIRIMSLPQLPQEQLREAVRWEMEGYIPLPIDDVYYDWRAAETIPPQQKGHVSVLVVAAARTVVDGYIAAVTDAGLRLVGIEPDSVADVRALAEPSWRDESVMILWIGATQSRLSIVIGAVPIFTVSIPVGMATVTADLERAFGIATPEARRILATDGIGSHILRDPVFQAVEPGIATLAEEIRRSGSFCIQSLQHCDGINRIVLCGAGASVRGLRAFLVRRTGLPVVCADPWRNAALDPGAVPPMDRAVATDAVTAIGLALRTFSYEDFA